MKHLTNEELKWLGIDLRTIASTKGKSVEFLCAYCGNNAWKPLAWFKRSSFHCCSVSCQKLFQKKAVIRPCVICGDNFSVRPSEVKKYKSCSKPECRKKNKEGKNNPNYRHGKAYDEGRRPITKEYKMWRVSVFERDKYTCQMCGQKGGDLNADHIKPWAYFKELRYKVENGRTLCVACHKTTYKDVFQWRVKGSDELGIDFDGTIAHSSYPDFEIGEPLEGAVEALQKLHADGWKIWIHTARPSVDYIKIEEWCERHGIKIKGIVTGKPLFKYYIDDRALAFKGDWKEILDQVK